MPQTGQLPVTIIGLDTETTSLDPATGDIIEFSAIKYELDWSAGLGREVGELTRLARPRAPISPQITAITGINQSQVENQPPFSDLRNDLRAFIGSHPMIFAHNAAFDINYLAAHGLELGRHHVWDTFTLSSVAWPTAPSYNLGQLAQMLNINVASEHRAGADVRLTWELLQKIYECLRVDLKTHTRVIDLLSRLGQTHYAPLFRPKNSSRSRRVPPPAQQPNRQTARGGAAMLNQEAWSAQDLREIFSDTGPLARTIHGFSARPEQISMAQSVDKLIREKAIGLIEAGTGTGKTYAYLIPLLLRLSSSEVTGRLGVVATHTKNLQDQLFINDVPRLLAALGLSLKVATLKGRRNYLCASRFEQALKRKNLASADVWLLIKVLVWLDQGGDGDLEHLNTSHQGDHLLRHLNADALSCRTVCALGGSWCPYEAARRTASAADLLIINHALLAQLHPLGCVVVDEAHHLEQVIRQSTAVDLSSHRVAELAAPVLLLAQKLPQLKTQQKHIRQEIKLLMSDYQTLIAQLTQFHIQHSREPRLALTPAVRRNTTWQKVIQSGHQVQSRLRFINGLTKANTKSVSLSKLARDIRREIERFSLELERFISGSSERIQWLTWTSPDATRPGTGQLKISDVALSIQPHIGTLFTQADCVILTSATLTTKTDFSYIKQRLGITNAAEKKLGTSLDLKKNMLIYIVDDGPEPAAITFDTFVAETLKNVAITTSGRLLVLFTSHASVRQVYSLLLKELQKSNIKLLAQKVTGGRHNVVSNFQKNPRSVLIGTSSFWEGIDIPGENLSCTVIPRLPFAAPHDPVITAIADSEKLHQFRDLVLPETILKLRQGIGRLLRSSQDRGAIILLDRRLVDAAYSDTILASLPPATVKIGSQRDLVSSLIDWFGPAKIHAWKSGEKPSSSSGEHTNKKQIN